MGEQEVIEGPNRGQITSGLERRTLVEQTLEFVRKEIPKWRDDPNRPNEEGEERLNAQLCKFLNAASRAHFPMVCFSHEEKQTGTRRVDFSALPSRNQFVGSTFCSIYDPFIVFEGKRLPAPAKDRKKEYVTGGSLRSGGIQRFKLGLHGANHRIAALVGYVQRGTLSDWFTEINDWIRELRGSTEGGGNWADGEELMSFVEDRLGGIGICSSLHPRGGNVVSPEIVIRHFWPIMNFRRERRV
jgi:hypothetical protein